MVAMAVLIVAMTVAGHLDAAAGSQGPLVADVARSSCRTPSVQQRWIQLLRRAPFFRRPAVAAALAAAFPSGASARPPSFRASFAAAAAAAAAAAEGAAEAVLQKRRKMAERPQRRGRALPRIPRRTLRGCRAH